MSNPTRINDHNDVERMRVKNDGKCNNENENVYYENKCAKCELVLKLRMYEECQNSNRISH